MHPGGLLYAPVGQIIFVLNGMTAPSASRKDAVNAIALFLGRVLKTVAGEGSFISYAYACDGSDGSKEHLDAIATIAGT